MTTAISQFLFPHHHKQQLLLLLLLLPVLVAIFASAAEEGKQQQAMPRPGCPDKCGNISIAFPFGVGPGCFLDGFEVLCNHSRAFLVDNRDMYYYQGVQHFRNMEAYQFSRLPLELISISVARSEVRVYATVPYNCTPDYGDTGTFSTVLNMEFKDSPFTVSVTRNVLISVGTNANAVLRYDVAYYDGHESSCLAEESSVGGGPSSASNGTCKGLGCCQAPLRLYESDSKYGSYSLGLRANKWKSIFHPEANTCNYGMLVEKSWYNFSTPDMYGNLTLLTRYPLGVALALDFGFPGDSCQACVSGNSFCANTTPGANATKCKCREHYDGNPYLPNGCQDIDECKQPQGNPCKNGGICKNSPGGFDCPCKSGMKDDGKGGTCTDVFPTAAKAAVGAIGGILLLVILLFLAVLRKEKKKTKEFYNKNGGLLLEKANVIKLFKKGDLKPILKSSNLIGKGCFGEVYKGLLGDKLVAVKKPINGSVLESEQFANEVIIQSQVIHKNIVRLIGCCLEVDAPMLVYEFISQGSLHDILHSNNNNNKVFLNLDARVSIAAQSADGLAYMHSKANIRILHGDVKPANILLDDNFEAKISDFGISRLIARDKEHTTSVIGDMNYMDPVYLQEGILTEKVMFIVSELLSWRLLAAGGPYILRIITW